MACDRVRGCFLRVYRHLTCRVTASCLWGLFLLLVTVFLWSATSLLLQLLFLADFPRPLFSTLVQSACPSVFLLLPAAAALRASSAWRPGGGERGLRAPIWQVTLAGFLAKDAHVLSIDSCLRLLQQQRHQQQLQQQQEGGSLAVLGRRRRKIRRLLRLLLLPLRLLIVRFRGPRCSSVAPAAASTGAPQSPAAVRQRQQQQSPEPAAAAAASALCLSPCERRDDGGVCVSSRSSTGVPGSGLPAVSCHHTAAAAAAAAAAGTAGSAAVSRRIAALEGVSSGSSSSCCSGLGRGSPSNGETTHCLSPVTAAAAEEAAAAAAAADEVWGLEAEGRESLAVKELNTRMRSVKSTVPLTVLWLVAQLAFDASLTALTLTSNSVVQSTSVFLSYFLAVFFLKQSPRKAVLSWLLVLAAGVVLISSHVPTAPETDTVRAAAAAGAAAAAAAAAAATQVAQPDAAQHVQQLQQPNALELPKLSSEGIVGVMSVPAAEAAAPAATELPAAETPAALPEAATTPAAAGPTKAAQAAVALSEGAPGSTTLAAESPGLAAAAAAAAEAASAAAAAASPQKELSLSLQEGNKVPADELTAAPVGALAVSGVQEAEAGGLEGPEGGLAAAEGPHGGPPRRPPLLPGEAAPVETTQQKSVPAAAATQTPVDEGEAAQAATPAAAAAAAAAPQPQPAAAPLLVAAPAAAAEAAAPTAAAAAGGGGSEGMVYASEHGATDTFLGYVLAFLAAAAYALHTTALKAQENFDPDFDVDLIYGLMGLWVLVALPLLTLLLHLLQLEVFMWPDAFSWAVLLLCGLVGTAFADICWGRAVFLLNPVVATAASNVQIPISLWLDAIIFGRRFDGWYFVGMVAVVSAVIAVTLITADKRQHNKTKHKFNPIGDLHPSAVSEV
ncbi:hypothetical protein, conserved [Eimeria tenella]|uniref:EamA domain-containing protein n=1 Tax=Eimeria tenella TaxID=5802 RepID=U6KJW8_EIMTE|nr:hypothetical protein, conserved [Eimeria tenella]CDJ38320.1 hypothetical protein, conserved [Eimeria tenella]|eukprot:XP_013229158.1 hypothetical protein, conserved [Eimeria tenella]